MVGRFAWNGASATSPGYCGLHSQATTPAFGSDCHRSGSATSRQNYGAVAGHSGFARCACFGGQYFPRAVRRDSVSGGHEGTDPSTYRLVRKGNSEENPQPGGRRGDTSISVLG